MASVARAHPEARIRLVIDSRRWREMFFVRDLGDSGDKMWFEAGIGGRGRDDHDCGSARIGLNFERSAQLPQAFAHSGEPYSHLSAPFGQPRHFFRGNAPAIVVDGQANVLIGDLQANVDGRRSGVTVNVREALLDGAEKGNLKFG